MSSSVFESNSPEDVIGTSYDAVVVVVSRSENTEEEAALRGDSLVINNDASISPRSGSSPSFTANGGAVVAEALLGFNRIPFGAFLSIRRSCIAKSARPALISLGTKSAPWKISLKQSAMAPIPPPLPSPRSLFVLSISKSSAGSFRKPLEDVEFPPLPMHIKHPTMENILCHFSSGSKCANAENMVNTPNAVNPTTIKFPTITVNTKLFTPSIS